MSGTVHPDMTLAFLKHKLSTFCNSSNIITNCVYTNMSGNNVKPCVNSSFTLFKPAYYVLALYGAETLTLRAADQKYLESFEMWCWRRMEKISWTDQVRNEDVLLRVNEQRNILHEIRKRKANWNGHILETAF